jgi:hypothetical protein
MGDTKIKEEKMERFLKKLIGEYAEVDPQEVTEDMSLADELYLSEDDIDDILDEMEDILDLEILEDPSELATVADLIDFVRRAE